MPMVPRVSPQTPVVQRPQARFNPVAPQQNFRGLAQLGAGISDLGQTVAHMHAEADSVAAKDAYNRAVAASDTMLYGREEGVYSTQTGKFAVNALPMAQASFDKIAKQFSKELSPSQEKLFKAHFDEYRLNSERAVMRWAADQTTGARIEANATITRNAAEQATRNPYDRNFVNFNYASGLSALRDTAAAAGWDKARVASAEAEYDGIFHSKIADAYLTRGDTNSAAEYVQAHAGVIDPEVHGRLERGMKEQRDRAAEQTHTSRILDSILGARTSAAAKTGVAVGVTPADAQQFARLRDESLADLDPAKVAEMGSVIDDAIGNIRALRGASIVRADGTEVKADDAARLMKEYSDKAKEAAFHELAGKQRADFIVSHPTRKFKSYGGGKGSWFTVHPDPSADKAVIYHRSKVDEFRKFLSDNAGDIQLLVEAASEGVAGAHRQTEELVAGTRLQPADEELAIRLAKDSLSGETQDRVVERIKDHFSDLRRQRQIEDDSVLRNFSAQLDQAPLIEQGRKLLAALPTHLRAAGANLLAARFPEQKEVDNSADYYTLLSLQSRVDAGELRDDQAIRNAAIELSKDRVVPKWVIEDAVKYRNQDKINYSTVTQALSSMGLKIKDYPRLMSFLSEVYWNQPKPSTEELYVTIAQFMQAGETSALRGFGRGRDLTLYEAWDRAEKAVNPAIAREWYPDKEAILRSGIAEGVTAPGFDPETVKKVQVNQHYPRPGK